MTKLIPYYKNIFRHLLHGAKIATPALVTNRIIPLQQFTNPRRAVPGLSRFSVAYFSSLNHYLFARSPTCDCIVQSCNTWQLLLFYFRQGWMVHQDGLQLESTPLSRASISLNNLQPTRYLKRYLLHRRQIQFLAKHLQRRQALGRIHKLHE